MAEAKLKATINVEAKIHIELSVNEALALEAMTSYGATEFLKGYYKQLGKSYMQPYERGVHSLFETIRHTLPSQLRDAEIIGNTILELQQKLNIKK